MSGTTGSLSSLMQVDMLLYCNKKDVNDFAHLQNATFTLQCKVGLPLPSFAAFENGANMLIEIVATIMCSSLQVNISMQ